MSTSDRKSPKRNRNATTGILLLALVAIVWIVAYSLLLGDMPATGDGVLERPAAVLDATDAAAANGGDSAR